MRNKKSSPPRAQRKSRPDPNEEMISRFNQTVEDVRGYEDGATSAAVAFKGIAAMFSQVKKDPNRVQALCDHLGVEADLFGAAVVENTFDALLDKNKNVPF